MKLSQNNIHTGEILANYLESNKISKTELGRRINRNGMSILQFIQSPSIQTGILIDICHAVKHNFLIDLANQMPAEFTSNVVADAPRMAKENELQATIKAIQDENNTLRIQNELLMKLRG